MKKNVIRDLIFILIFRPLVWILLGLNIKYRERLLVKGPAILVANHNSHLDTIVLMSLFPMHVLPQVRPVAAAEYFLCNRYLAWICKRLLQIIPLYRPKPKVVRIKNPLQKVTEALEKSSIVIFYPEGTRGEPEKMGDFKKGIARLSKQFPNVPIQPIYLQGLGKALPKGTSLFVPFNINMVIGEPLSKHHDQENLSDYLQNSVTDLAKEI